MWYMHDGWGWGMVFGGIWMILFWGTLIALIIWGVNRWGKRGGSGGGSNGGSSGSGGNGSKQTPLDIARERYARGEITREQFEQIKKDLG